MIVQREVYDRIERLPEADVIQVRRRTDTIEVAEDGTETEAAPSAFFRYVLAPGDNLAGQPPEVIAIAEAVWAVP